MDWKEYEREIFDHFKAEYPSATVVANTHLRGKFSRIDRQIDLLVEGQASDFAFRIIVDAKHRERRIDVNDVEQFLGLLRDVGADVGVLVSPEGYSDAAINRAYYDDSRVELDILNFKDLKLYQGFGAIPFSGENGVLMQAPFGWVIEIGPKDHCLAFLYQQGLTIDQAREAGEWMYVNLWTRAEPVSNLAGLLRHQESYMRMKRPDADIQFLDPVQRTDGAKTAIRVYRTKARSGPEYTGFIEFDGFIFFCVLLTPTELEEKNIRKLRSVVRRALPLKIRQKNADAPPIVVNPSWGLV